MKIQERDDNSSRHDTSINRYARSRSGSLHKGSNHGESRSILKKASSYNSLVVPVLREISAPESRIEHPDFQHVPTPIQSNDQMKTNSLTLETYLRETRMKSDSTSPAYVQTTERVEGPNA